MFRTRFLTAGALLLLALARAAAAQPAPQNAADPLAGADRLSREALVAAVLARNPGLDALRQAWRAAAARPAQARALDDPMLSWGVAPLSLGSDDVSFGQAIEMSQGLPYPGTRRLRGAAAEAGAEAARGELRGRALDVAAAASRLFDDWYLVHRALAVNAEHRRLLAEFKEVATSRYAAGLAAQQDPLQAEVEIARLLHRDAELEAERAETAARLNALLHRPQGLPLPPPPESLAAEVAAGEGHAPSAAGGQAADLAELEEQALAARPELEVREAERREREAELELAVLARRPGFEVMGSYSSMWMDTDHRLMVGVAVNLPVRRERLEAARAEAEARLAAVASEREALADEVRSEVRVAWVRLAEAHHLLELLASRMLPASRDQIRAARAGFESGQGGFLGLIEAERNLRQMELEYHEALAQASRRRADLDRALGRPPAGLDLPADLAASAASAPSAASLGAAPGPPATAVPGGVR